jgi:ABC-2 type transport system ATP-binding protein
MTSTLELSNVSKRYADHVAVSDLSLSVSAGSVYGLLGPNGAGKTTTIRMVLNVIAPDEGTIRILGQSSASPGLIDRVGYLPEERGLYKKMQVRRVLRFLAELKNVPGREADRRINVWLDRLGLITPDRDWGNAKVDELSRGMQQKVQFIATLLHEPDLVILDEPFSGLDPINTQTLRDTILELKRQGRTVIFSTHLMDSAQQICDAVCIIARGRKVLDGDVATVRSNHGARAIAIEFGASPSAAVTAVLRDPALVARSNDTNRAAEVNMASGADSQLLLRRLLDAGALVERFELVRPSLHQIFLDAVGTDGAEDGTTHPRRGNRP